MTIFFIACLLISVIVMQIRTRKKLQSELSRLRMNDHCYQSLYQDNPDLILTFDRNGRLIRANKTAESYGCTELEWSHQPFDKYVVPEKREAVGEHFREAREGRPTHFETTMVRKSGERVEFHVTYTPVRVNHRIVGVYGIYKDITNLKKVRQALAEAEWKYRNLEQDALIDVEETIQNVDCHDPLTGLPNRDFLHKRMETAISDPAVEKFALLRIDLDRFPLIHDTMGNQLGDALLKAVSQRLQTCLPDQGELFRNSGDDFYVFIPHVQKDEAADVAQCILDCFVEPFSFDPYEIDPAPSMGISLFPEDGEDVATLLKKADLAVAQVRRTGGNHYQYSQENQAKQASRKLELEWSLRKALKRGEFYLLYQPKLDLASGKIAGVEALIRWEHPEKGVVSPGQFIPLAEETGLIIPIGEWGLHTACRQNKAWQEAGLPPMLMSVNLSVRQLYQPNMVEMVKRILGECELAPEYLELEITESMMMDIDHALPILKELRRIGIQISMDDFGTGYSSLYYLKEFPIHKLKIDQSFVRNCTVDSNDAVIVKTIIAIAHQLKLAVVAEGVESKEHLVFLQQNLCNEAQGYLFSKPLAPDEFVKKIAEIEQIVDRMGIPAEESNQKWLEEALKVARQEMLDTVRQQQGMIFKYTEIEGRFIHTLCDGELLYRMGLVPEQIIGKELGDVLPARAAEEKKKYYERAWQGEENVTYEGEVNGLIYLASLRPVIRGGKVVEVIASCVDITERKRFEEALRLSETKYRLIAENMSVLVGVLDTNGIFQYASPSHETILGFSPSQYEGNSITDWIHPDDLAYFQEQFARMLSSREACGFEIRYKHATQGWIYVQARGNPVLGREREVESIVFVTSDKKLSQNSTHHASQLEELDTG